MIVVGPTTKIFLAREAVDFRCGIDALAQHCRATIQQDPFSGSLFVFRNRARNSLKCIHYDGQGFWLHQKRLSNGQLKWWPTQDAAAIPLTAAQLQVLLWNGTVAQTQFAPLWKPIAQAA